ncbi:ferredoxin [Paenarthrobacter sp. NPDC089675]|uniref:ferredoxin n=1 Tax=Paenarthrobacter TaxID=1742992 RepID=UPI0038171DB8
MKIFVDRQLCENHGQCAIAAPDVFRMNAEGILEYDENVDDSLLADVEDAQDACPVQAIFIQDQP